MHLNQTRSRLCWLFALLTAASPLLGGCAEEAQPGAEAAASAKEALRADNGGNAFALVSRYSGKCLDIPMGDPADGANVQQYDCNGFAPQSFRLQTTNDGYFALINVATNKAVEVWNGALTDPADVDQWTYWGGAAQQFQLVPTSNGWYRLVARHSGKVLNVAGCASAVADINTTAWTSSPCQEWRLQPVGNVKLINKNSGKVLTVSGGSSADGANVELRRYDNQSQQHFALSHVSNGFYRITPQNSGKAVEVASCSGADGGNIAQWSWLNNQCQQWRLALSGDGYAQLVNRQSGKVMEVVGCATADGSNVAQWGTLNNDCQKWRLEGAGASYNPALDVQAHDPHLIKQGSYYYLTGTGGTLSIRRSTDRLNWTTVGNVFSAVPSWIAAEVSPPQPITDLWAPDIAYFGGRYWLYYSASVFATNKSVIGVASTPTLDPADPSYGWTDSGLVLKTTTSNNYNAIDANVTLDAAGAPWMAFGSFWTGIKMRRIDAVTGKLSSANTTLHSLASRSGAGAVEGPSIMRANGYYYLFVSFDSCCQGADSNYRTMVGRSANITGPYVNAAGLAMASGNAEQLLVGTDHWRGPGGGTAYFDGVTPYFTNHAYDATDYGIAKLQIRPITWVNNWPVIGAPIP